MQSTSQTWKSLAAAGGTKIAAKAIINNVEYTGASLSPPVISRALMQSGVTVGNVVSAVCAFSLRTTNVIPKSAEVQIKMRLEGGTDDTPVTSEWLPAGTYYISKRSREPMSSDITLECYDSLLKANAEWVPASSTWPQLCSSVVSEIATNIGLTVDSRTSIDANYSIGKPDSGTIMRDVLATIAQYHGGNWIVTPENKLRLVPMVDTADAEDAETDVIDVDAVIGDYYNVPASEITGVRWTVEDTSTLIGDETGYVVDVSIPGIIAADLAETLIGMEYQPYTLGTAYYDPAVELGDYVRYGNDVASVLCIETIELGPAMCGDISAPDAAEIGDEYPYVGKSAKAVTIAKAYASEVVNEYDEDLTQQKVFNKLTDNGAAQGLVLYNGQLYINASYIQSGTLVLGGLNNENGILQILNASGVVIGKWDKDGLQLWNLNGSKRQFYIDSTSGNATFGGDVTSNGALNQFGAYRTRIHNSVLYFDYVAAVGTNVFTFFKIMGGASGVSGSGTGADGGGVSLYAQYYDYTEGDVVEGSKIDIDYGTRNLVQIYSDSIKFTGKNYGDSVAIIVGEGTNNNSFTVNGDLTGNDFRANGDSTFVGNAVFNGDVTGNVFGKNSLGTISDANDTSLYGVGFYQANAVSNLPTSAAGVYYELVCMGTCQMAYRYSSAGTDAVFARYYTNSQWYSWVRIDGIGRDDWQELSNTTKGLTTTVKINKLTPRLAKVRIRGTTTEALSTSSGYVSMYQTSALSGLMADNYVSYGLLGGTLLGQIAISSGGLIQIGYTRKISDDTPVDISSGANVYWESTIILK